MELPLPKHIYNSHYGNGVPALYLLELSSWMVNISENLIANVSRFGPFLSYKSGHCTEHGLWRHRSNKSEMFGPNVADQYFLSLNKNLSLGCYFWLCCANSSSMVQTMYAGLVTGRSQVCTWSETPNIKLVLKTKSYSSDIHLIEYVNAVLKTSPWRNDKPKISALT